MAAVPGEWIKGTVRLALSYIHHNTILEIVFPMYHRANG